jgi:hypothetical protein
LPSVPQKAFDDLVFKVEKLEAILRYFIILMFSSLTLRYEIEGRRNLMITVDRLEQKILDLEEKLARNSHASL